MKNPKSLLFYSAIVVAFAATACTHGKIRVNSEDTQITKNALISIDADWVKEKKNNFNIQLKIKNISDNDIIILLNDMQCYKGTSEGMLKHTFFNTGERTIDFRKGQMKQFRMVCTYGEKTLGDDRIVIGRIFDNPQADGETRGKVLMQNIEWKFASKE